MMATLSNFALKSEFTTSIPEQVLQLAVTYIIVIGTAKLFFLSLSFVTKGSKIWKNHCISAR